MLAALCNAVMSLFGALLSLIGLGGSGTGSIPEVSSLDDDSLSSSAPIPPGGFDYNLAFSRNIGWVTRSEQQKLRRSCVAIAGMGGVGGAYAISMARLGVGRFKLADFDEFEIQNFNRQAGATMSNIGKAKVQVIADAVRDINPEAQITIYTSGVTSENLHDFLSGADCYMDGLDYFAYSARESMFAAVAELGVPATTVAPLGMGAALLNFVPGKMTFEEYFRWEGCDEVDKAIRFMIGLAPAGIHRGYLVDPTTLDFAAKRGPSTICAIQACAGIACTEAMKMILKRGNIIAAPRGVHVDMFTNKMVHTWRPWGNRNPIQQFAIFITKIWLKGLIDKSRQLSDKTQ